MVGANLFNLFVSGFLCQFEILFIQACNLIYCTFCENEKTTKQGVFVNYVFRANTARNLTLLTQFRGSVNFPALVNWITNNMCFLILRQIAHILNFIWAKAL